MAARKSLTNDQKRSLNKQRLEQAEKIAQALASMKLDDDEDCLNPITSSSATPASPIYHTIADTVDKALKVLPRKQSLENSKMQEAMAADTRPWDIVRVISEEDANRLVLNQGAVFKKHGRLGIPHPRHVWLSADSSCIYWQDVERKSRPKCMAMADCSAVYRGKSTGVFKRVQAPASSGVSGVFANVRGGNDVWSSVSSQWNGETPPPPPPDELCLSLVSPQRSLDLVASTYDERDFWYEQLRVLRDICHQNKLAGTRDIDQRRREQQMKEMKTEWLTVTLPQWDKLWGTPQLMECVWSGVPPSIRAECWPRAIGNALQITPELYDIFKNMALQARQRAAKGDTSAYQAHESSLKVLEKDLPRTFAELGFFHNGGPLENQLREVLETFVFYRPDVGYVQGMSFLAAMLLLYMDSYPAFVALANMLHSHYFLSFFRMDMVQIRIRFAIYETFFEEQLPSLARHFKEVDINPDMYLLSWLLTLYTKSLSLDFASRIWDCYFVEGETFMIRAALGLLRFLSPQLECAPFEDIMELLTHLPKDLDEQGAFANIAEIKVPKAAFEEMLLVARRQAETGSPISLLTCQSTFKGTSYRYRA